MSLPARTDVIRHGQEADTVQRKAFHLSNLALSRGIAVNDEIHCSQVFANIILTDREPAVDVARRTIELGRMSDGIFIEPAYPCWPTFGGIIELTFDSPEEAGIFEVELVGEIIGSTEAHVIGEPWVLEVPPCAPDWDAGRAYALTFEASFGVYGDLGMSLAVYVDREFVAERRIVVRDF